VKSGAEAQDGTPKRRFGTISVNRSFARLWVGEAFSEVGSQVTTIAMPLLVLALTGSPAKAGLIGVARSLALPLSSLPAGVLADRLDRRRLMIACALGRLVALGSVPLALAIGRPPFLQLLLVSLLEAMLASTSFVTERGLLADVVPAPELADAVTLNEARAAGAVLTGPPLGGALFGVARSLPFLADTFSFGVVAVALAGLRVPGQQVRAPTVGKGGVRSAAGEAWEGLRWLWGVPFMRAGSILYASANVTINAIELLGILVLRRHGASSAAIGGAYALVGAGGLIGAVLAGPTRRRVSVRAGVLIEPWAYALFTPLLLVLHSPLAVGIAIGCMFLPITVSTSIIVGQRLMLAPEHLRSRVQASGAFTSSVLSWTGPLAMGLLVEYVSENAAVLALTGWALVTALVSSFAPGLRRVPGEGA
jgi:predicted MFS family arabinose efflux permease